MTAIEVLLFYLHPHLDHFLTASLEDFKSVEFRTWHNWYVNLSSVQWVIGLVHTVGCVATWKAADSRCNEPLNS